MIIKLTTDNEIKTLNNVDVKDLDQLREALKSEGSDRTPWFERVRPSGLYKWIGLERPTLHKKGVVMLCDEEGLMHEDSKINYVASLLYDMTGQNAIVGDVLFVGEDRFDFCQLPEESIDTLLTGLMKVHEIVKQIVKEN